MKLSAFHQFFLSSQLLLVGFSGGLDSTVLLHRLMLLRDHSQQYSDLHLRAIHVHHGLSKSADEWVAHCQSICAIWDIPLIVKRVFLKKEGTSIEGQARKARYNAFASSLLPGERLVTAHHLNDQCETLLLALKRGSGPAGLSAMPIRTKFASTQHLRPLLNTSRASLEAWGRKHNLCWIRDESNQNDNYERNFLRLHIIPLLVRRWPCFLNTAARSAQLCAEQENLLDELLANELLKVVSKEGAIEIAILKNKNSAHRMALLRRWFAVHQTTMPSRDMLMRIWNEVALARHDANPVLHLNIFDIRRYKGWLWLVPCLPVMTDCIFYWFELTKPLILPHNIGEVFFQPGGQVRLPTKSERVTVRFQAHGIFHLAGRNGGRKLKKIWQEYKVPPWRRKTTPLLFYGDVLIAAAGIFITQEGYDKSGMKFIWKK